MVSITGLFDGILHFAYVEILHRIFPGWLNVELFDIPASYISNRYLEIKGWWRELEEFSLFCVPMLQVFACYSELVFKRWVCQDLEWCVIASGFVKCSVNQFLVLACNWTDASASGKSSVM